MRLNDFLRMRAIIGALPAVLVNGTTADASQVMADFNFIVSQVNANAQPIGPGTTFGAFAADLGGTDFVFPNTAVTGIILGNVNFDVLGEYNVTSGIYTASAAGIYVAHWRWTPSDASQTVDAYITKNGLTSAFTVSPTYSGASVELLRWLKLAQGDQIAFLASTGATPNSVLGTATLTYGSVIRVA